MNIAEVFKGTTKWYSPIGSWMELEQDEYGNLTGTYYTKPGNMTAKLAGKFDTEGGAALGWTVAWPLADMPSNSSTAWAANVKMINNVMTIESSWMIREMVDNNSYYSTVTGTENYTPNPPSESEIAENIKHIRPPHPIK